MTSGIMALVIKDSCSKRISYKDISVKESRSKTVV